MKKYFKTIYIMLLCALIACCFTACGNQTADSTAVSENVTFSAESDKSALYGYSDVMIEMNVTPSVYTGTLWRIDNEVDTDEPRTFRTVYDEISTSNLKDGMDEDYIPSDKGIKDTKMSGSAEFDEYQIDAFVTEIRKYHDGNICVVDLRQESHLYVNGRSLSWYGLRDWGNIGKNTEAVTAEEETLKSAISGKTIDIYYLDDDKQPCSQELIEASEIQSEEEVVTSHGLSYYRLPCTDHVAPTDGELDEFIELVKNLSDDTWLHFHCEAGKGRTTYFMIIYDMMKNPDVSLKDIVYRQCMIGGNNVLKDSSDDWKDPYYAEKAERISLIYQYVQENHDSGYDIAFSSWHQAQ